MKRPKQTRRALSAAMAIGSATIGCAHASVGLVAKPLPQGAIISSEMLSVRPFDATNVKYEGDYSDNAVKIAEAKQTIQHQAAQQLVAALETAGLNAAAVDGEATVNGLVMECVVTRFDRGSLALRTLAPLGWILGGKSLGGSSSLDVTIKIRNGAQLIAEFEVETSSGGSGLLNEHLEDTAHEIANYIKNRTKWTPVITTPDSWGRRPTVRRETEGIRGMQIAGPIVFGAAYVMGFLSALLALPDGMTMAIPFAGPWMMIGRDRGSLESSGDDIMFAFFGVHQIVGLGITIGGFAIRHEVGPFLVSDDDGGMEVSIVPFAAREGAGLTAVGRF